MFACVSAACALGLVALALLTTAGILRPEQAVTLILRGFVLLLLFYWASCATTGLFASAMGALSWLARWSVLVGLVGLALITILLMLLRFYLRGGSRDTEAGTAGPHINE